jgi:mono/diheme cytochrome c family protein
MNCDGCHGGGVGFVVPIRGRTLALRRQRLGRTTDSPRSAQGMPAYGGMLDASTIWQLVTYPKSQPIPVDIATEAWLRGT